MKANILTGAFAARHLATLIEKVGLPKDNKGEVNRLLFKKYIAGKLRKRGVADHLRAKYKCHKNVEIEALCCFDTVGSLGIPHTGIFGITKIARLWTKKMEFHETDPAHSKSYFLNKFGTPAETSFLK
jgi:hypothetical protein